MKKRKERLPIIVDLLTHKMIGTQEELLAELAILGYPITQATLSRDLKQLKTSKVSNGMGGYTYVVTSHVEPIGLSRHPIPQLPIHPIINSIDQSSNIIVIKSPANHAKLLAAAFESLNDIRLLASFSVTDNVLLVLAPNISRENVRDLLNEVISSDILELFPIMLDRTGS